MKSIPTLNYELRDYQKLFIGDALQQIDNAGDGASLLYASPTGSGKSLMELTLHSFLPDNLLITPRLEIVAGMLRQCGVDTAGWSTEKLAAEALEYRITTPIRARNMLAAGTLPFRPTSVMWDEAHHRSADSYQDIRAFLGGGLLEIGLTACPFRGTPKGTEDFLASWDSLTWILTYPDAAARGVIAVPSCTIWPLVDDDQIDVVNGEFVVAAAQDATLDVVADVAVRCERFRRHLPTSPDADGNMLYGTAWDRPTIFAVSTTDAARALANALSMRWMPAVAVTQDTPRQERDRIFRACERAEVAIVQIDVVSEGVDLKLRRLIDLRPTLSPVKWLQQVGRITRPVRKCAVCRCSDDDLPPCAYGCERPPEYICCNRNLERHCYLYDGAIPPKAVATAQQAFEKPSNRAGARAVGVESMGRFAAAQLPLADGTVGLMYNLTAVEGFQRVEYAVLLHPCSSQPLYASRTNTKTAEGNTAYGKWQVAEKLPDLRGFQSAPPKTLSDKQRAWWERSAARCGLNPAGDVNRRNFAALPILSDLGISLRGVA